MFVVSLRRLHRYSCFHSLRRSTPVDPLLLFFELALPVGFPVTSSDSWPLIEAYSFRGPPLGVTLDPFRVSADEARVLQKLACVLISMRLGDSVAFLAALKRATTLRVTRSSSREPLLFKHRAHDGQNELTKHSYRVAWFDCFLSLSGPLDKSRLSAVL